MPSDDSQDLNTLTASDPEPRRITTSGSMARARRRRLAVLAALAVLLAALSYAAYYYSQNRRLPVPQIVSATTAKLEPPQFLFSFAGTAAKAMTKPTGIAVIGSRVYVTDYVWRTVRAYTRDGNYLFDFGAIKDGANTRLDSPVHMAVSPGGEIWVTDRSLKGVYIFDGDGNFVRKFVPSKDKKFSWSPLAIAFGPDGKVFITDVGDSEKHRVLVFSATGAFLKEWGSTQAVTSADEAPGSFLFPNGIAVGGTGADTLVYVADANNRRVQVFKPDGTFVQVINTSGTPRGLALDAKGRLYVVDALSHRVDIYTSKGALLTTFGENGSAPGQFNFPNDVVIDAGGRILITDRENNQVQVWGFPVAEIPGVTRVAAGTAWLYLLPLPLLLLPLLFRRRRFVVTRDFVDGMVDADLVGTMAKGRWRWVMTEADAAAYQGRVVGDVNLGEMLNGEPFSDTEAGLIKQRFALATHYAGQLAMAKHYHVLCTDDVELARFAAALGIDVYDRVSWLQRFAKKG
jgi:DNA-binding beta-propeller fold protein YncE